MRKELRKPFIAANYKMNLTRGETAALIKAIRPGCAFVACEVALAVPAINAETALKALKGSEIQLALQNVHFAEKGAYTGEISVAMAKDSEATYIILGHSERREMFGDTDEVVAKKLRAVLDGGLKVVLCVGESLSQREEGKTLEHIFAQLKSALSGVTAKEMERVVIAYEPIWAIGTGKTASPEQAGEVCGFIRGVISGFYGDILAEGTRILYGGSMNGQNAQELLSQYDIDGGLIGSASLKPEEFLKIVKAVG